jgi:thiamine-phosphate pyrophosphorylase
MPPPTRLEEARRARELCRARGIPFLVARDVELAHEVAADGFHCPQSLLPGLARWRRLHPEKLLCAACHDEESLGQAAQLQANIALLSPIFPTRSHPGAPTLGAPRLSAIVRAHPDLPIFAMGGVNLSTVDQLIDERTGVAGIAGIDLIGDLSEGAAQH